MDRTQLDRLVPAVFALAVVVCALWVHDALVPVAVVGGILVGVYYSVFRARMLGTDGVGRQRDRDRNRG